MAPFGTLFGRPWPARGRKHPGFWAGALNYPPQEGPKTGSRRANRLEKGVSGPCSGPFRTVPEITQPGTLKYTILDPKRVPNRVCLGTYHDRTGSRRAQVDGSGLSSWIALQATHLPTRGLPEAS